MNEKSPREFVQRVVVAVSCTIIVALILVVQSSALGVGVEPDHPRILISLRDGDPVNREVLRDRVAPGGPLHDEFTQLVSSMFGYLDDDASAVSDGTLTYYIALAFIYQLDTERTDCGQKGAEFLVEYVTRVPGSVGRYNYYEVAIGYDWLYEIMSASQRSIVGAELSSFARNGWTTLVTTPSLQFTHDVNPYHGLRHAVQPVGYPLLAVSQDGIDGELDVAGMDWVTEQFPNMLAGTDETGGDSGGWFVVGPYGTNHFRDAPPFFEAWRTATGEDYFTVLDSNWAEENVPGRGDRRLPGADFWRHVPYWYMYNSRPSPEGERMRSHKPGDAFQGVSISPSISRLLAERYHNPHFEWYADQIDLYSGSSDSLWEKILYQGDPDYPAASQPNELVRYFSTAGYGQGTEPWQRAGTVYMRSGWDFSPTSTDVTVSFKDNLDFYRVSHHDHAHRNSFVITRGMDSLAIDSGNYDAGYSEHHNNYSIKSWAHNTIVVDGESQRFNDSMSMTPGAVTEPDKVLSFVSKFEAVPADIGSEYVYVQGDATEAYDSTKVESYLRDFVWIGQKYFVVLDRVLAEPGVEFSSLQWLLHTIHWDDADETNHIVPAFYQDRSGTAGTFPGDPANTPPNIDASHGGTPGYYSENTAIVRTENGGSALFCSTLLPASHRTTMIGGPDPNGKYNKSTVRGDSTDSYEYWWNGRNYPVGWMPDGADGYNFNATMANGKPLPPDEGGNWRIEVEPTDPQADQLFLHVLYPTANTVSVSETPETVLIETSDLVGVHIKAGGQNVVAAFSSAADGSVHGGAIEYAVTPTAETRHIVHDLVPDTSYDVSVVQDASVHTVSIASGTMFRSSAIGMLAFTVLPDGHVNQGPSIEEMSASPDSGESPLTTSFSVTATDTDGTVVSSMWNFGDGTGSDEESPSHTFTRAGRYTVRCSVTDNGGDVADASIEVFAIDASAPTSPVLHYPADSVTDTGASLGWEASQDDEGVSMYRVYRDGLYVGSSVVLAFDDTGLQGSTTYEYHVTAVDVGGNESASSDPPLYVTTLVDTTAPAIPTGLMATPGNGYVTLSWSANPEPDIAEYRVYRGQVSGGDYVMVHSVTSGTSWRDESVTNDTTYFYVISAADSAGNPSGNSGEVEATPSVNITFVVQEGVGGYTGVSDTRIEWFEGYEERGDINYSDDVRIGTRVLTAGRREGLIRSNLEMLPEGAEVQSAVLELNVETFDNTPPGPIALYRMTVPVDLADCSWNYRSNSEGIQWGNNQSHPQPGIDYDDSAVATATLTGLGPVEWDITSAVAGWVSGVAENHGLFIVDTIGGRGNYYSSSEALDETIRPKLTIVYRDTGLPPGGEDSDGDGLSDETEATLGTDPNVADTDGDALLDGDEVSRGTNPLVADTDGDGLSDGAEVAAGTDPLDTDTDDDGVIDGEDPDPLDGPDTDTDSDGLLDSIEATLGTDPNNADTSLNDVDGDGFTNLAEVEQGTSPIDPSSYPTPPYIVEALSHPFPGQGIIEGSTPVAIDDSVVIRLRDDTAINPAQVTMTLEGTPVTAVVRPVVPDDFSDCWVVYDFDGHYGYGDEVALGLQAEDTEGYVLNHTMDFRVETEAERAAADSTSPPVSANGTGVLANPGSQQSGAELAFSATEPVKPTFGSVEQIPQMDSELSVAAPVVSVVPFTVFEEPITVLVPVVSGVPAEKLAELQIYYYDPSPGGGWRPVTEVDGLLVDDTRVDHVVDDEFNSLEALNALVQEENADREIVITDTAELDPELTEDDVRVILHQEVVDDSPAGTWIESDPETWTRK